MTVDGFGPVGVIGGGSWATALAKLLLKNCPDILWYMRRPDRIADFRRLGHNPVYLSDVDFDTDHIHFSCDINEICSAAKTLVIAVPSPYFLSHVEKIGISLEGKNIASAVKGMVPEANETVTHWMCANLGCREEDMMVIGGPCHAEEVALDRLSYLTIACHDRNKGEAFAKLLASKSMKTIMSCDVIGLQYASVLKNVYAIAAGIVNGLKSGDNFMAVLACNAIKEMREFLEAVAPGKRDICDSAYLGDLLVTSYSRFSRNHNFGSMIGKGYSVAAARMEMSQTAEGWYGTKCMHELCRDRGLDMPLLDCVWKILYENAPVRSTILSTAENFT